MVLHSQNGGESWALQLDGNDINRLRIAVLEKEIAALNPDIEEHESLLDELGYKLEDAHFALEEGASTPLLDVWFTSRQKGYVAGAYGAFLMTQNGGKNWQSLDHQLPNPEGFHLNAIHVSKKGSLYLAGEAGLLIQGDLNSTDWTALDTPYQGSFFALQESQGLYLMGLRGHLFYAEHGLRWQPVQLPTRNSINAAVKLRDSSLVLVGQAGLLLRQGTSGFSPVATATRTSFSAGVAVNHQLILVGEAGITRVKYTQNSVNQASSNEGAQ